MLTLGFKIDSIFDNDFNDIKGIIIIQKLFIFFNTSSIIKPDLDPPPPIITLSGCIRFCVILFSLNIFNTSSSIIKHGLTPSLLAFSLMIFSFRTVRRTESIQFYTWVTS